MENLQLPPDFKKFLLLLDKHNLRYLLIGGYAVSYYGYPRATGDMDIWIDNKEDNIRNLLSALEEFGFETAEIDDIFHDEKTNIIRMGRPPLRIELLKEISGVEFDNCFDQREEIEIDDLNIKFINLSDLIKNKKSSGRHKDLDDIENLGF